MTVGTLVRYSPRFLSSVSKKHRAKSAEKRGIIVETNIPGAPTSFVLVRWESRYEETQAVRLSDLISFE